MKYLAPVYHNGYIVEYPYSKEWGWLKKYSVEGG